MRNSSVAWAVSLLAVAALSSAAPGCGSSSSKRSAAAGEGGMGEASGEAGERAVAGQAGNVAHGGKAGVAGSDNTAGAAGSGGNGEAGAAGETSNAAGTAAGGASGGLGGTGGGGAANGGAGAANGGSGGSAGAGLPNVASRIPVWSERFGGLGAQDVEAIAAPATGGGVVLVGQMEQSMVVSGKTLTSGGSLDAFAIKLDEAGNVLWSLRFGDAGDQRATHVAIDASGNVFVGGFTQPASTLGFGTGVQTGGALFLVEVDKDGKYLRGGVIPSTGNARLTGLAVGPSDTILYAASLEPGASIDTGCQSPYPGTLSAGATSSVGAVELSSTLACAQNISVSAAGSLGVVYTLKNQLLLPTVQPAVSTTPAWFSVTEHPFAKWSSGSTLRDSVTVESLGQQVKSAATATDGGGGLLFGGSYFGVAHVNGTKTLPAKTSADGAFAAKANEQGEVQWAYGYGDTGGGSVTSVAALSNSGSSFIAGWGQGSFDFGGGPVIPVGQPYPFATGFFVARLNGAGTAIWASRFTYGPSYPNILIACALDDKSYVAGALNGSTDLGKGTLTSAGDDDIFVARYAP